MKKIAILMATYNGEKYVNQQIDSLLLNVKNLGANVDIFVSDDGSQDKTLSILKSYPENLVSIINIERQGGVKLNFKKLISSVDADYVFFSDQDDFWLPNKLSIFMEKFQACNPNEPVLIHSDLIVADENIFPMHISMFKYQKLKKEFNFRNLLVQNHVTGCVMALNRPAIELIKRGSLQDSVMHDWYAALIVSSFGKIIYVDRATVLYRQHGNNQVGAKNFDVKNVLCHFFEVKKSYLRGLFSINSSRLQAIAFRGDYCELIPPDILDDLNSYIDSFDAGYLRRVFLFIGGYRKSGFIRNFVYFLFYVFFAKKIKEN